MTPGCFRKLISSITINVALVSLAVTTFNCYDNDNRDSSSRRHDNRPICFVADAADDTSPSTTITTTVDRTIHAANDISTSKTYHEQQGKRPRIYTYYEQPSTNDDEDKNENIDELLLHFWKECWYNAGFDPIILYRSDYDQIITNISSQSFVPSSVSVKQDDHNNTAQLLEELLLPRLDSYSRILFRRWAAVAFVSFHDNKGNNNGNDIDLVEGDGGDDSDIGCCWYSDYDNFPLRSMDYFKEIVGVDMKDTENSSWTLKLPNNGRMTLHDHLSPSLATGTGQEWIKYLHLLLIDSIQRVNDDVSVDNYDTSSNPTPSSRNYVFWTDTLSLISISDRKMGYYNKSILQTTTSGPLSFPSSFKMPVSSSTVATPYGRIDPVMAASDSAAEHEYDLNDNKAGTIDRSLCNSKQWRNKWTVRFSPEKLQSGMAVPPSKRHPRYRKELAETWLTKWNLICNIDIPTT